MLLLLLPTRQKTKQALSQHQAGESGTCRPRDKKVALLVAVSNDISLLHRFIARDVQDVPLEHGAGPASDAWVQSKSLG